MANKNQLKKEGSRSKSLKTIGTCKNDSRFAGFASQNDWLFYSIIMIANMVSGCSPENSQKCILQIRTEIGGVILNKDPLLKRISNHDHPGMREASIVINSLYICM
jgi:hypothetical protein